MTKHLANSRKGRKHAGSLELSVLEAAKVKRLTQLHDQFVRSLTDEQRIMLAQLNITSRPSVARNLTRLVALLTVGDDVLGGLMK